MGIGEFANFAAYTFAPASLVTPLGALSVLVSAVLSSKYLKENLNLLGKVCMQICYYHKLKLSSQTKVMFLQLGCVLCVLGSTIIVIHSPKEEEIESLDVLLNMLKDAVFINYTLLVIIVSLSIAFYFGPKYGSEHVVVYIILCSAVGSLTVMSCKGLGLAIKDTIAGTSNEFTNWLTYLFLFTVVICIFIQMNYLNKALDLFNTSIVTPVYYVFFTTLVIFGFGHTFPGVEKYAS